MLSIVSNILNYILTTSHFKNRTFSCGPTLFRKNCFRDYLPTFGCWTLLIWSARAQIQYRTTSTTADTIFSVYEFDEIHPKSAVAISNDSTTAKRLSSSTIHQNHHCPSIAKLLLQYLHDQLKIWATETASHHKKIHINIIYTTDNLTPIEKLHLQEEFNGAIKKSQSSRDLQHQQQ